MGSSRPVLTADGHGPVAVDGLNRPQQPGERVLYGPGGPDPSGPGPVTSLPGGWTLAGPPPQPADGGWQVHWQADDHLDGLDAAVSGGPRLLHDGGPAPEGWWRYEGFAPSHTDVRHPRTAIGVNAHGATMLLVVDGRQPGWSTGLTHSQTANLFASLGVTDATMLDGGGSSQLAVDGQLVNRPCCDTALRPVATVLTFDDPSR